MPKETIVKIVDTPIMNAREAALFLKVGKSTLYELARRGEIPFFTLGKTMRFRRDELDQFCRGEKD